MRIDAFGQMHALNFEDIIEAREASGVDPKDLYAMISHDRQTNGWFAEVMDNETGDVMFSVDMFIPDKKSMIGILKDAGILDVQEYG